MTNYEAMRTMDKDELVEFLSSIMDGEAIRIMDKDELAEFLSSIVDCKKCPALGKKFCDGHRDCDDAIRNWLNARQNCYETDTARTIDTGGNVTEEIKLLNSISHVSARLARNLSLLAASQSEEGGKENVKGGRRH